MSGIFKKKPSNKLEKAIEPTPEEKMALPMKIAMFGWELTKIRMGLFNYTVESGKRTVDQVRVCLEGDPEKIRKTVNHIYSDKSLRKAKDSLDNVKKDIEAALNTNFQLFQLANFILKEANREEIDLDQLQVSEEKTAHIFEGATPENIYDKLNEYRDYLEKVIDNITEITNNLPLQLAKL